MVDLNVEMGELWASLGAPAPGRPRAIQFVAARRGEGTSTVAREFARFAAKRAGRRVWLVDLDLFSSPQAAAIAGDPERYGQLGAAVSASPDGSAFFTVQPPLKGADGFNLIDDNHLVVVQNAGVDRTVELVSTDGWQTATIVRTQKSEQSMPTAAVKRNGHVYVLNSRIDTLFKPDAPKVSEYILQQF